MNFSEFKLSRFFFGLKTPSKIDKLTTKYELVKARNRVLEREIIKKDKTILFLAKKCLDLELKLCENDTKEY
jgi:hypothetical protein